MRRKRADDSGNDHPGLLLGAALGELALTKRDRVNFFVLALALGIAVVDRAIDRREHGER